MISMSIDSKYERWVKKTKAKLANGADPDKVFEVYREVPVLREKLSDDPLEYRFHSPLGRSKNIQKLHSKIDNRLDNPEAARKPSSRRGSGESQADYYVKWQSCQMEIDDLKKELEAYKSKFKEIDSVRSRLEKEVKALHETADSLKKELGETRAKLDKQSK